ncbi:MAG: M20/M25/M40 family metallo-hydrolase [Fimbriimonadaceae bacterium]|nr:M20/M25/M40 family metallo-hydrolase [Fimbriimonadaceae bacterium]
MVNEERLVSLFRELCLIDAPSLAEAESVAHVKGILTEMGLRVEEDRAGEKIGGNANNLIAWLDGNVPGAPKVFLSAHFDTVEPTRGLEIGERDGVLFSESDTILGADDKAGMAPAIEAVRALIEIQPPHGDVCLLFSVAEEIGLKGAAALDIASLGLDFGYVLDTGPPVGSFVTRTGSHDKLDVTILGKPAHAGKDPEKGISAIEVAAEAISGMKLGRIGPETTANIGVIEGGTGTNIVCPKVHLRAEARSTSVAELDAQIDHMVCRFEAAAEKFGAQVIIDHARHYGGYSIEPQAKVVAVAAAAAGELGFGAELRTTLGGSDANVFNAAGVPCIVLGTGMQQIHTHDEHVSRADLVQTARLAYRILVKAGEV